MVVWATIFFNSNDPAEMLMDLITKSVNQNISGGS